MASLIAWAVIGLIFFIGISLEHDRWTRVDVMQIIPALAGVMLLWPIGLVFRAWRDLRAESDNG